MERIKNLKWITFFVVPLFFDALGTAIENIGIGTFVGVGSYLNSPNRNFYLALLALNIAIALVLVGILRLNENSRIRENAAIYAIEMLNTIPFWSFLLIAVVLQLLLLIATDQIWFLKNWYLTNSVKLLIGYSPLVTVYFWQKLGAGHHAERTEADVHRIPAFKVFVFFLLLVIFFVAAPKTRDDYLGDVNAAFEMGDAGDVEARLHEIYINARVDNVNISKYDLLSAISYPSNGVDAECVYYRYSVLVQKFNIRLQDLENYISKFGFDTDKAFNNAACRLGVEGKKFNGQLIAANKLIQTAVK